jgi:predicted  nucleic acid-binding Zn-ribbon protein
LKIGVDLNVESMIKKMKEEIVQKETEKKRICDSLARLNQVLRPAKEKVVQYSQVLEHLKGQLSARKELIEKSSGGEDRSRLDPVLRESKILEEKLAKVEEELHKSVMQQNPVVEKISACELRIEELDESLQSLQQEIQKIREESQSNIQPPLKVPGQIFAGTVVEGCHSSQVIRESLESVLIKEIQVTRTTPEGNEGSAWGIQVSPL